MTIEIQEAIKLVESYKKYASQETQKTLEIIIREFEHRADDYNEEMTRQYKEAK